MSIVSIERMAWTHDGERSPCAATSSNRSDQHVPLSWPTCVADEVGQHVEIPPRLLWQREEQVGLLAPRVECGHAAMSGLKEIARVAKGVAEGLLRVADVFQMCRQIIDEFERCEFLLHLQPTA